jgi:hypothetical protein
MRSVAVFRWDEAIPLADDENPERAAALLSYPAAVALLDGLRARGCTTNVSIPYEGEGGWHFTVTLSETTFSIFTMWTGIGNPDENYLAIQPTIVRGCLAVFLPRPPESEFEPLCQVLDPVLTAIPQIARLQWINDGEFRAAYCQGKPLPPRGN